MEASASQGTGSFASSLYTIVLRARVPNNFPWFTYHEDPGISIIWAQAYSTVQHRAKAVNAAAFPICATAGRQYLGSLPRMHASGCSRNDTS